jgi:hypothetical protein
MKPAFRYSPLSIFGGKTSNGRETTLSSRVR